jgi:Na+/proline symporter
MKKDKKSLDEIWDIIDDSVIIILVYYLLELFLNINLYIGKVMPSQIFSTALMIFAFGLVGYRVTKQKEHSEKAAKYGAYSGLIIGLISAIVGIITFYMFPERIAEALKQASQTGVDTSTVKQFMKLGLYVNFVLSPAIYAGIGALISWVSSLIFKKK